MRGRRFSVQVARAAAHVELGAAVAALARQSREPWPVKVSLSRNSGAAVVAEVVVDARRCGDNAAYDLGSMLDHGQAWVGARTPSRGHSGRGRLREVREALDSLGWQATDGGHDTWVIQEKNRQTAVSALTPGGRGFVSVGSSDFVCLAQPPALIRVTDEDARLALTLLSLEANQRLQLARTSIEETATGDAVHARWQAVVPIDGRLDHFLDEALAATWVARESTLAAYRALAAPTLARTYLAAFNATHSLTNKKENEPCKQQAAI